MLVTLYTVEYFIVLLKSYCSFLFSRDDGGWLRVGILGRPEGASQSLGCVLDSQRGVWRSGQPGAVVLALPAAAVHQRHRVRT